jgi:hypothetical protein
MMRSCLLRIIFPAVLGIFLGANALAQPSLVTKPKEYPPGSLRSFDELPPGRLRTKLDKLPARARQQAKAWLDRFHFTEMDVESLDSDQDGGIYYVDHFETGPAQDSPPITQETSVPVSPFPASLKFHSRLGCTNVLYLDMDGENVTGTQWNISLNRPTIYALPYSIDTDYAAYSEAEQAAIKRIWERVAEDYAPFYVDVTTERPAVLTAHTGWALITRNTDAQGTNNPASTAGGVAYVDVFGASYYGTYRPAWIYCNNLGNADDDFVAEATSHELGHNLGLSHDGTASVEYYQGHGSGDISWGPLMGTGYNRNVSQWSKGEYYQANNTEDDLAILASKISCSPDDHGDTPATATALVVSDGTTITSTTPETDPAGNNSANKGILEKNTDVDVFKFTCGTGPVNLQANPWVSPANTRGGNLDIALDLLDANGTVLASNNPGSKTGADIQTNLSAGVYYLRVGNSGSGSPLSASPTGYTSYGSIGQYFLSGTITAVPAALEPPSDLHIVGQ